MTEVEFSRQLSELSNVAADLNRESDSINDLLSQYEARIRAMNVGLSVSVTLARAPGRLEWTKLTVSEKLRDGSVSLTNKTQWGLAINREPVLECPRESRIAALESIPHLVEVLTEEARSRVDVIQKAKELLK